MPDETRNIELVLIKYIIPSMMCHVLTKVP